MIRIDLGSITDVNTVKNLIISLSILDCNCCLAENGNLYMARCVVLTQEEKPILNVNSCLMIREFMELIKVPSDVLKCVIVIKSS